MQFRATCNGSKPIAQIKHIALVSTGIILMSACARGAPFRNLDFEESDGVLGIPHWTIPSGIDYLHNAIFAGEGAVTLFDNSFPFFDFVPPITSSLAGQQSVLLVYDPIGSIPPSGGVLVQEGMVPERAERIAMLVTDVRGLRVSLNGINIPLSVVSTIDDIQSVTGNVASFAGTTAELRIESPFGSLEHFHTAVDSIQFTIPEPSALILMMTALLFGLIADTARE
jgi:hypothetical protein